MQVLIAYGSKRGGTAGLAEMIGDELAAAGLKTAVKPAREVRSLDGFDSVVIAGALYATVTPAISPADTPRRCAGGRSGS